MKKENGVLSLVHKSTLFTISLLSIILTSCVSYKPITKTDSYDYAVISKSLVPKNTVRIRLKSGEVLKRFKVLEIDSSKISGYQLVRTNSTVEGAPYNWSQKNKTIRLSDIQELKKRKFSTGKTAGLIIGGLLGGGIIALMASPPVSVSINLPPNAFHP
ncbi:MAG: hypothetical protein QM734_02845 [Cyclobacteriaceae bacterium]